MAMSSRSSVGFRWHSTVPQDTMRERLVHVAGIRSRIERDYQDLKQELGL
ncbi:transposase, IS4 family domain protein [Burkholderia thailandensis]|uniref:Transposase, IS4 family domain protein n=1 Tax=Burkholderia thailandensis TaxID=57975 RepID=A0AAW9CYI4_BURTH|nr:transposase, IS4 family domain protein [Burkholderia thailandensis]MDW9252804.1 transposase, IS4 family domain protein [Burkholderia thailandensis]